jgi:hypothetical protein
VRVSLQTEAMFGSQRAPFFLCFKSVLSLTQFGSGSVFDLPKREVLEVSNELKGCFEVLRLGSYFQLHYRPAHVTDPLHRGEEYCKSYPYIMITAPCVLRLSKQVLPLCVSTSLPTGSV